MSAPSAPIIRAWPVCATTSINFIWAAPASGAPLTNYTIACSAISYSQDVSANLLTYTVTGLTAGTEYDFTITATNATGTGPAAAFPRVAAGVKPFGPSQATASTIDTTTALVTWTPSTIANEAPTRWYILTAEPSTVGASTLIKTEYAFRTSTFFKGLSTNVYYRFLVQGVAAPGYCPPFAYTSTLGFGITTLPFSPSSLTGMQLWFDAADPTSLTLTGSNITAWADKSGKGYNATGVNNPQYTSGQYVSFNGTNQYFTLANGALPTGNSAYSYFGIVNFTTGSRVSGVIGGGTYGTNLSVFAWRTTTTNEIHTYWWASDVSTANRYTSNTLNYINSLYDGAGNRILGLSFSTTTTFAASGTRVQTNSNNTIGTTNTNEYMAGRIHELMCYSNQVTPFDRQKIEGYLAWKWGMQTQLPALHPFYAAAPTATSVFSPSSFGGLRLWIDAQDITKVTLGSGSTITALQDKSPNAYTFSNVSGYGYSSNSFNTSYPSFTAPGVSGNSLGSNALFTLSNPITVFFVGKNDKADGDFSFIYNTPQNTHSMFKNNNGRYSMMAPTQVDSLSIAGTGQSNIIISANFNGAASAFVQNGSTITSGFNPGIGNISSGIVLGQWYIQDNKAWGGKFCEFMMFSNVLSTDDRQTVEGYLAWKWGLQGSLPATHPYFLKNPASTTTTIPAASSNLLINFLASSYSGSGAWSNAGSLGTAYNAGIENGTPTKNGAGNGIVLNGATNFAFSTIGSVSTFTMSVWFKRTAAQTNMNSAILADNYRGTAINMSISRSSDTQFFGGFHNNPTWTNGTPQTFTLNQWTMMTCTWDGSNFVTYINGASVNSSNYSGRTATSSGANYRIGRGWDDWPTTTRWLYVTGEIGQVLIYNRPITSNEVYQLYGGTSTIFAA